MLRLALRLYRSLSYSESLSLRLKPVCGCALLPRIKICSCEVIFVQNKYCRRTFETFRKGRGKVVFGHNKKRRLKQTNNAVKLFPYIVNLDSGEPYFSSKATSTTPEPHDRQRYWVENSCFDLRCVFYRISLLLFC